MSKQEEKLTEQERIILHHELEEWRYLNDYVNKMDIGYMQIISLLLAIITGIMAIIFSNKQIMEKIEIVFFLIPAVLISVFGYMSYQFRITAILRGALSISGEVHESEDRKKCTYVELCFGGNFYGA